MAKPKKDPIAAQIKDLEETKVLIHELEDLFKEQFPDAWQDYQEALNDYPKMLDQLKKDLKESGVDRYTYGDFTIPISRGTKKVMDVPTVVEEAKLRGELDLLLEHRVLTFDANPGNLDHLPAQARTFYEEFVEEKEGTVRITPPKQLKL